MGMRTKLCVTAAVISLIAALGHPRAQALLFFGQPYQPPPTYACPIVGGDVDVTTCGDVATNYDTAAIQAANDKVAAAGGGRVIFPPGAYQGWGIRQDSNVAFVGRDGAAATSITRAVDDTAVPLIEARTRETYGTIAAGSSTLTVRDATGVVPGALVAIRGAGAPSSSQRITFPMGMSASASSAVVRDGKGLPLSGPNFVLIDNEIVSYKSIKNVLGTLIMSGLARGQMGTSATAHGDNAYGWQVARFYAQVVSVSGNTVMIDRPASRSVYDAATTVGAIRPSITGLTLQGYRSSKASAPVVLYELTNQASITDSVVRNGDQMGVRLSRGSRAALIANDVFEHNGYDAVSAGVWLFNGASGNTIRNNTFNEDFAGIVADDRSYTATEWDAAANANRIEDNVIRVARTSGQWDPNIGVLIEASQDNVVARNEITGPAPGDMSVTGPWYGVYVQRNAQQGNVPSDAIRNDITDNVIRKTQWGVVTSGSLNEYIGNLLEGAVDPVWDFGTSNYYESNVCTDAGGQPMDCGLPG